MHDHGPPSLSEDVKALIEIHARIGHLDGQAARKWKTIAYVMACDWLTYLLGSDHRPAMVIVERGKGGRRA